MPTYSCCAPLAAVHAVIKLRHRNRATRAVSATARSPVQAPPSAKEEVSTSASSANCALQCQPPAATDMLSNPPYAINNLQKRVHLGSKTLPVTARHLGGELEYDAHNLYGFSEAAATRLAVKEITGKRAFVLSRSVSQETLCAHPMTHITWAVAF